MDNNIGTMVLPGRPLLLRAACALLLMLMLLTVSSCRRERGSGQPASPAPTAMPDSSSETPAQVISPTADTDGPAVDDDPPAPVGVDMPTPTIAASSADVTSTAPEPPILRAVRVGQHAGHDRVVFEFEGEGMPAWRVEYVDAPITDCGAGNVVPVAGNGRLQVRFSGANAHTPAGLPTSGPARRTVNQPALLELVRICDFEAEVTWVAGVATTKPYQPHVLTKPARLVIDISH